MLTSNSSTRLLPKGDLLVPILLTIAEFQPVQRTLARQRLEFLARLKLRTADPSAIAHDRSDLHSRAPARRRAGQPSPESSAPPDPVPARRESSSRIVPAGSAADPFPATAASLRLN